MPPLDSGSVPRSDAHGSFPGRLLAQARTIGLSDLMVRAPRATIGAVVGALGAGLGPVEDELPLVAWLDERGPLLVWARATRRAIPTGTGYRLGTILGGAVEFEASDPRRYELVEQTAVARLPVPEPGLAWPLAYPLEFGSPGSTGGLSVTNTGAAATHPVIEFRGPVERPSITNLATGDTLEYDLPLVADDVLTVDTRAGTVVLNGTASRLGTATSRSQPEQTFTLAGGQLNDQGVFLPATTDLTFRAAPGSTDTAASVVVRYRSAHW
ncbi:phage distal tail protein [Streptomyces sp. NBC_01180]|uniref:phage distal tail protein n=1 Tax=Streptomyces sp. NBC_01180 TaxID=2903763 RepID=UPI003865CD59|nr:phage tail family protein [Streptomyces sp. NBC_01180]